MPTKMSPNAVFDGATAKIWTNEEANGGSGKFSRPTGGITGVIGRDAGISRRIEEDEGKVQPQGAVRDGIRLHGGVRLDAFGGICVRHGT